MCSTALAAKPVEGIALSLSWHRQRESKPRWLFYPAPPGPINEFLTLKLLSSTLILNHPPP